MVNDSDIVDRLNLILQVTEWKKKELASRVKVGPNNINRYIEGNGDIQSISYHLGLSGINLHWLYYGEGEMFANNRSGLKLKKKYGKDIISGFVPKNDWTKRALQWIVEHYGSLLNYCIERNLDYKEQSHFIRKDFITPELFDDLREAGCNTEWVLSGKGEKYGETRAGYALKNKLTVLRGKVENNNNRGFVLLENEENAKIIFKDFSEMANYVFETIKNHIEIIKPL